MIDTLISLKLIFILMLGILALDEVFLGLQTTETVNFFTARADLVDEDIQGVDDFFNKNILTFTIFTKENPFFRIDQFETSRNSTTNELVTAYKIHSLIQNRDFIENSRTQIMERP